MLLFSCKDKTSPTISSKQYSTDIQDKYIYIKGDTVCIDSSFISDLSETELKQRFIDTGNNEYYIRFCSSNRERNFLYNLISANKWNNIESNYDFYLLFEFFFRDSLLKCVNIDSLDQISKVQVMDKLQAAANSKAWLAKKKLATHYKYGIGINQDTKKASDLNLQANRESEEIWKKIDKTKLEKKMSRVIENSGMQICIKSFVTPPEKKEQDISYPIYIGTPSFGSLEDQHLVCNNGDVNAYNRIKEFYKEKKVEREMIFFSIVMANKYNYGPACFDVYNCLWQAFNGGKEAEPWDMTRFDPKSREFALFYLKKGASLGNRFCKEILLMQF